MRLKSQSHASYDALAFAPPFLLVGKEIHAFPSCRSQARRDSQENTLQSPRVIMFIPRISTIPLDSAVSPQRAELTNHPAKELLDHVGLFSVCTAFVLSRARAVQGLCGVDGVEAAVDAARSAAVLGERARVEAEEAEEAARRMYEV